MTPIRANVVGPPLVSRELTVSLSQPCRQRASLSNKLVRSSAGPYCRLKTNRQSCRFSSSAKNGPRRGWQYLNVRCERAQAAYHSRRAQSSNGDCCRASPTNHRTIGSALLLPQMAILGDLRRAAAIGTFRPGRPGQRRNWDRVDRICPANVRRENTRRLPERRRQSSRAF